MGGGGGGGVRLDSTTEHKEAANRLSRRTEPAQDLLQSALYVTSLKLPTLSLNYIT